jgi:MOSC domain-containing protein YiiM
VTRLQIGNAVVELTAPAHTGCAIFVRHFGEDAVRFVNGRTGRSMRLRGANARVVTGGSLRRGDMVTVHREPALW